MTRDLSVLGIIRWFMISLSLVAACAFAEPLVTMECVDVFVATKKLLGTPHHSFSYVTVSDSEETVTSETIVLGSVTYVRQGSEGWHRGLSVDELQSRYRARWSRAKQLDCAYIRDEILSGELVAHYYVREDLDGSTDDTDLWITRREGLILGSESDIHERRGRTVHTSIRHEFNNVEAPSSGNR
jgi:hypothetical protein